LVSDVGDAHLYPFGGSFDARLRREEHVVVADHHDHQARFEAFDAAGLQIVYLGWFMGDWSLVNNAMYSCADGLEIRRDGVADTGDLYGVTALDEDFTPINQMIKYYKFGFGRVTDYVNEEIRLGRMSRAAAIKLVEQYDNACGDSYIEAFSEYIGLSVDQFWAKVHSSVNRQLFEVHPDGRITPKFRVGAGL
jgi:hypothetical protein